jgi:hypothetical protein
MLFPEKTSLLVGKGSRKCLVLSDICESRVTERRTGGKLGFFVD